MGYWVWGTGFGGELGEKGVEIPGAADGRGSIGYAEHRKIVPEMGGPQTPVQHRLSARYVFCWAVLTRMARHRYRGS